MFHAILFFLYHIKTKEHGMLRYCVVFQYLLHSESLISYNAKIVVIY